MVILDMQKCKSYYESGFTEGSVDKPLCFSDDMVTPSPSAEESQCETCALCPHNAWGSGSNDKGEATKGKACSDTLRLAIASPANLDDPYMLRVPPASLKAFAEASKWLSSHNVPINRALIRIGFDTDKTGVLTFKAIGGVDSATYAKATQLMNSELVLQITGKAITAAQRLAQALPQAAAPVAIAKPAGPTPEEIAAKAKAEKIAKM